LSGALPSRRFPDPLYRQGRAIFGGIRAWMNLPNLREGSTLPQVTDSRTGAALAPDHPRLPWARIPEPAGGAPASPSVAILDGVIPPFHVLVSPQLAWRRGAPRSAAQAGAAASA